MYNDTDLEDIARGKIQNAQVSKPAIAAKLKQDAAAYIETDMRAMYNPSRMKVIERATKKLADKINSLCPNCDNPGFGITDIQQGLPCEMCNFPTRSTLKYIYTCMKCNYEKEEKYPNGKLTEDPMNCDICNP